MLKTKPTNMNIIAHQQGNIPNAAPASVVTAAKAREVRFASRHSAKKAGDWAIKKYAAVFKKLAA